MSGQQNEQNPQKQKQQKPQQQKGGGKQDERKITPRGNFSHPETISEYREGGSQCVRRPF